MKTQQTLTNTPKYDNRITIWTIGHSNRSLETFAGLLKEHEIKILVDVRSFPTCIMCMEPNPKYCHRRFVSAHLKRKDIEVVHILKKGQMSLLIFRN